MKYYITSYFSRALQYSSGKGTIFADLQSWELVQRDKYLAMDQSLQNKGSHPGGGVLALHLVLFGKTQISIVESLVCEYISTNICLCIHQLLEVVLFAHGIKVF